jgi:hypothetical protein
MNIVEIQDHGNKAVQYLQWAESELKAINNLSLAEHVSDLGTMLEKHIANLPYMLEDQAILAQAEEQEIYHTFG